MEKRIVNYCTLIKGKDYRRYPHCPICMRTVHASRCNQKNLDLNFNCMDQESDECLAFSKEALDKALKRGKYAL